MRTIFSMSWMVTATLTTTSNGGRLADAALGTRSKRRDELVTLIRRIAKCYAGLLSANRAGQAGYAESFEIPKRFPGRMREAANWSPPSHQANAVKPWLAGLPRLIFVSPAACPCWLAGWTARTRDSGSGHLEASDPVNGHPGSSACHRPCQLYGLSDSRFSRDPSDRTPASVDGEIAAAAWLRFLLPPGTPRRVAWRSLELSHATFGVDTSGSRMHDFVSCFAF